MPLLRRHRFEIFLVILLALAVRLLPGHAVLTDTGWSWAGGPDAWYQFRRAELAATGASLAPDMWINYPYGETVHWSETYARLLGLLLAVGGPAALAGLPIATGVAAAALVAALLARADLPGGRWAGALYAILPATAYPTALGAIDHHCLEALWAAIALIGGAQGGRRGISVSLFAIGAATLTVPAWPTIALLTALPSALRMPRRGVALVALGCGALALPLAGWSYFSNPWIQSIEEAKPLISSPQDLARAVVMLSPGFVLLPLALADWWRRRREPVASALLAATAIGLPLALLQARFCLYLAIPCAAAAGYALSLAKNHARLAVILLALCFLPPLRGALDMRSWAADPDPAVRNALTFLSENTPQAGDPSHSDILPAYGVVAAWDLGHHILALGHRPAIADPFHTGAAGRNIAAHILFDTPAEATAAADVVPAPILFLTNLAAGYAHLTRLPGQPSPMDSLYGSLYFRQDTRLGWRRAYASSDSFFFEGIIIPSVQIWIRSPDQRRANESPTSS